MDAEQEPQGYHVFASRDLIDALRRLADAQEKANRIAALRAQMDWHIASGVATDRGDARGINRAWVALKEIKEL